MLNKPNDDYSIARKIVNISGKSPLVWGVSYIQLPKGTIWSFEDRRWQADILEDLNPELVVRKPTQVGATTMMTVKVLWFIDSIKSRAMITLPRRDDVNDYVATTINPIIEESEVLRNKVSKTDTMRMKRVGDSFLHVMEASVTPRMLPVDILANDEVDMSNPDNIEQFRARLDASEYAYHYRYSTPTVSGYGIDADFSRSDKRRWMIKCSKCNVHQVLDWEVNLIIDKSGMPIYACKKCKEKFDIDDIIYGEWVPENTSSFIHGYHVSHMMLPITRPVEKLYAESKIMDTKTFYNLRLGKPWRPVGGSMPASLFQENCFHSEHEMEEFASGNNKYFLGADQGNDSHILIGRLTESGNIDIVYAEHVVPSNRGDQFNRIAELMRIFNVSYGIVDANPNRVSVYKLCEEFNGKLSACDIGTLDVEYRFHGFDGSNAYKVNASRTDMLDGMRDWLSSKRIQLWGTWYSRDPVIDDIVDHCGALKRDTMTRRTQGGGEKVVGVWRKSGGPDHFAFALALLRLAVTINPTKSSFRASFIGSVPEENDKGNIKKSKVWEGLVYKV